MRRITKDDVKKAREAHEKALREDKDFREFVEALERDAKQAGKKGGGK